MRIIIAKDQGLVKRFHLSHQRMLASPLKRGYKGSNEQYKSVSITSNANFDSNHLAGSELIQFFKVPKNGGPDFISLEEFIKTNPRLVSQSVGFKLDRHPEMAKNHSFTFTFELTNGEIYIVESGEIDFQ